MVLEARLRAPVFISSHKLLIEPRMQQDYSYTGKVDATLLGRGKVHGQS